MYKQEFCPETINSLLTELLKSIIPLSQFALELFDTLMLYKLVATIEFDRKEFQNALNICHLMIYVCGINDQL